MDFFISMMTGSNSVKSKDLTVQINQIESRKLEAHLEDQILIMQKQIAELTSRLNLAFAEIETLKSSKN